LPSETTIPDPDPYDAPWNDTPTGPEAVGDEPIGGDADEAGGAVNSPDDPEPLTQESYDELLESSDDQVPQYDANNPFGPDGPPGDFGKRKRDVVRAPLDSATEAFAQFVKIFAWLFDGKLQEKGRGPSYRPGQVTQEEVPNSWGPDGSPANSGGNAYLDEAADEAPAVDAELTADDETFFIGDESLVDTPSDVDKNIYVDPPYAGAEGVVTSEDGQVVEDIVIVDESAMSQDGYAPAPEITEGPTTFATVYTNAIAAEEGVTLTA
jgi:hypothetical protein